MEGNKFILFRCQLTAVREVKLNVKLKLVCNFIGRKNSEKNLAAQFSNVEPQANPYTMLSLNNTITSPII
jgi:hypothetical protein